MTSSEFQYSMQFEHLLRKVGGKKYYQWASSAQDPKLFRDGIKKLIMRLQKDVDELDADERFKKIVYLELGWIQEALAKAKTTNDFRELFIRAMSIVATLFGYDWLDGSKHRQVCYIQSWSQELWDKHQAGDLPERYWEHKYKRTKDLISKREEIVMGLIGQGYTIGETAFICSISEYRVKNIASENRKSKK